MSTAALFSQCNFNANAILLFWRHGTRAPAVDVEEFVRALPNTHGARAWQTPNDSRRSQASDRLDDFVRPMMSNTHLQVGFELVPDVLWK